MRPVITGILLATHLLGAEPDEESVEQKYSVNADATLSIQNNDGAVRVYGGNVSEVTIQALKRAYGEDRLKQIAVELKGSPDKVDVQTRMSGDFSGTVDYTIIVPNTIRIIRLDLKNGEVLIEGLRGGRVTSHVGDGWLVARNSFGDMDLNLRNGRLEVVYDFWETLPFQAKLTSPEGDIRTYFPPEAFINIVARTASGRILNWLGKEENDPRKPVRALEFAIGATPSTKFEMTSTTGDIRIKKAY